MSRERYSSLSYITSSFRHEQIQIAAVNMPVEVVSIIQFYYLKEFIWTLNLTDLG